MPVPKKPKGEPAKSYERSKIFPGFNMLIGSKTLLISFISLS